MKVISWNCNGAFRKKFHLIEEMLDVDLMVIQECEDPAQSTKIYKEWAGEFCWQGRNKNKGIGIFSRSSFKLKKLDWNNNNLESFLPCRVNDSINLLAVWTKQANSPNFPYIGQLWKYIQLHKEKMKASPFLLVGDLNSNSRWHTWDCWWNHSDVVRELEEIDIHSLYHQYFNEVQGNESRPTLYHLHQFDKPYHVDYAFSSSTIFIKDENYINVGKADKWLAFSDHMPLIFNISD
ncbi:endonuclease [Methyloprofundus sedimenti]|uniref:Endonuclease n=1 Tax=Methyloprofundus sedimenti TaxID=1420851 RepID=A0A1V8M9V2_9GAMM|nr:endonuclease/exonuclease/phosphatase family protein [Methyloprofundus sedimenti]OQK18371.1 endonuclease [Methyloprofundus sedimenti]